MNKLEWILKQNQSFPRYRVPTGTEGFFLNCESSRAILVESQNKNKEPEMRIIGPV